MSAKIYDSTLQAFKEIDPPKIKVWLDGTDAALIPTMTSNTTPSGQAFAKTERDTNRAAWKAFDGDDTAGYQSDLNAEQWVGYMFTSPKTVHRIYYISNTPASFLDKIQASNDGSTWVDIKAVSQAVDVGDIDLSTNTTAYLYYRLYRNNTQTNRFEYRTIQMYGT